MIDSPRQNPPPFDWLRSVSDEINRHRKTVTVTAAYVVLADVRVVRCDATAGAFAVTLPTVSQWWGRAIDVIKTDASANAITVAVSGTDVINGAASQTLSAQYDSLSVRSNGVSSWDVIGKPIGRALTKVDDTNVTLTLGGGPTTALLAATSVTAGWSGQLSVPRGGTGLASLTANQIPYGNGTSAFQSSASFTFDGTGTVLVGDGTTGQVRLGGAASTFPMLKRSTTFVDLRLADDSAFAPLRTSTIQTNGFTLYTTQALATSIGLVGADTVSILFRTTNTTANGATFGHGNTGNTAGNTYLQTAGINQLRITPTGRVSIGGNANAGAGTAWLHLPAGTTAANTAPWKVTTGALNTTAEPGAFEYVDPKIYFTIAGPTRKEIPFYDAATTWTPAITFVTAGDLAVTYATQVGRYSRVGNTITAHFTITTSAFTHTTASGNLRISGFPVTAQNTAGLQPSGACSTGGVTKAGYTQFVARMSPNQTFANLVASGSGVATSNVAAADMPTGGTVELQGTAIYEV